jgi:hypothetical protein
MLITVCYILICPDVGLHVFAAGYKVYHHLPLLLVGLHGIGRKCKLINVNQYNLRIYIYNPNFV